MSLLANLLKSFLSSKQQTLQAHKAPGIGSLTDTITAAVQRFDAGDFGGAVALCKEVLDAPERGADIDKMARDIQYNACIDAAKRQFHGPDYHEWLSWFHHTLRPATYLEIGVESGKSLQFARPPTRAVGVDPALTIVYSQQAWVKLFQMTSDDFFADWDPREVFGADAVDLAFIDGLHTFDQALKDFINTERHAHRHTVVLFHDIYPVVPMTALRERITQFWLGDTWKAMMILRKYRPDLNVFTIPAYPSGLGVVTNLDANSSVLMDNFDRICSEVMDLAPEVCQADADNILGVVANSHEEVMRLLKLDSSGSEPNQ